MAYYRGWEISFNDSLPVTGKWRAERFGVGMCAGTEAAILRMIDTKTAEEKTERDGRSLSTHRVRLVTGTPFQVKCIECGKVTTTNREPVYADLDGKPWVDYYCRPCALGRGADLSESEVRP